MTMERLERLDAYPWLLNPPLLLSVLLCGLCVPVRLPVPSVLQIEQSTGNLLQCHPHPEDMEDPQKADLHCVFYMGLARNPAVEQLEGGQQEFDIRATVEHFKDTVRGYQGWREGMDISVTHMKRKQLPDYIFPGGVRPPRRSSKGKAAKAGAGGQQGGTGTGGGLKRSSDPGKGAGGIGGAGGRLSSPGEALTGSAGGGRGGPVQKVARTSMSSPPFMGATGNGGATPSPPPAAGGAAGEGKRASNGALGTPPASVEELEVSLPALALPTTRPPAHLTPAALHCSPSPGQCLPAWSHH